jgi:riboflavin biosynthesis pyrimidine reductase
VHLLTPSREIEDILDPYRDHQRVRKPHRPWVMANMVAGLDGSAAVRGRVRGLSDETDRRLFRLLRSLADVVLVGAETVRAERYGPARIDEAEQRVRVRAGRPAVPRLAVVTRSLELDRRLPMFAPGTAEPPLVITCADSDRARRGALAGVADVVVAGQHSVDLGAALGQLADRAPIVLCEGGPALLGQLVEEQLLDELCLTVAPVMGGDYLPVSVSPTPSSLVHFGLEHALRSGDALFLRYCRKGDVDG